MESSARRLPEKTALVCDERRVTYAELDDMANRVANALRANGIQRGDRVAIHLANSVEAVVAIFGVLKIGAVFVPINPTTKHEKLSFILNDCGASALFCDFQIARMPKTAAIRSEVPSLKMLICCRNEQGLLCDNDAITFAGIQERYTAEQPPCDSIDVDLACIIYTSGTTGRPKGVMYDHSNIVFVVQSITQYLQTEERDVVLNVLPLSFGYGLFQLFLMFSVGGTVVLERSFAYPLAIMQRIVEERITGFPAVPTIFALLLQIDLSAFNLSSVRFITNAAAALPLAHIKLLREFFPEARLYSMYGLTETTRALYLPPEQIEQHPNSVGIAIPGTEVWIEDECGKRVAAGEVGELVVRGRHVARGYWNDPSATAERFRPGALPGERICHTGDLFRRSSDGLHYFFARRDDVIKSRGEKVSPREIEEVLYGLDSVVEAVVFAVPDPILGQAVEAVLVTKGVPPTKRQVLAHCRAHLEEFTVPRNVHFLQALPRTHSGKIKRTELAACVASPELLT